MRPIEATKAYEGTHGDYGVKSAFISESSEGGSEEHGILGAMQILGHEMYYLLGA